MYINNFKVSFLVVFFTIVSFSSNTLNAQNKIPQTSSKQAQLKPIVIVPGKPRTIKVNPDQYAGIDFKSARLVNPKINRSIKDFRVQAKRGDSRQCSPNPKCLMLTLKKPGQRAIVSNIALN